MVSLQSSLDSFTSTMPLPLRTAAVAGGGATLHAFRTSASSFFRCRKAKPTRSKRKPIKQPTKSSPPTYMRSIIAAISNILRYSTWSEAQSQLKSLILRWDSFTINQVLKTHPPMEKAWLFFNWAHQNLPNFKHDKFTYTTMLDIFGEAGRINSMRHMLEEMSQKGIGPDVAAYTSAMHWMAKSGDYDGALRIWEEIRRCRRVPTVVSYTAFMKILLDCGKAEEAHRVYMEMIEAGNLPNCHTYTVMMDYLAGQGNFDAALKIMGEMQEAGVYPDKATCNILVQKCAQAGETSAMFQILGYMKEHSIVLRRSIFLEALGAVNNSGESDLLLREVNPHLSFDGIEEQQSDSEIAACDTIFLIDRGIILNLLANRNFFALDQILRGIMVKEEASIDSKTISHAVQTSCECNRPSVALLAFNYSKKKRKKLDKDAYMLLLGLLVRTGSSHIMDVIEEMTEAGIDLGTYHITLLIYKLGWARMSSAAARIFYSFCNHRNTATCSALIYAYFRCAEVDKAHEIFLKMKRQGIPASSGTYKVLIAGLQAAGKDGEAEAYKKEKKRLLWDNFSQERVSVGELLCNCLFDT